MKKQKARENEYPVEYSQLKDDQAALLVSAVHATKQLDGIQLDRLEAAVHRGSTAERISRRRRLSKTEKEQLRIALYGSSLDLNRIRLNRGGILTVAGSWVTINCNIYVPTSEWEEDFTPALPPILFHEVLHVWQYQNRQHPRLKGYWWFMALLEHIRYKDPYDYSPDEHNRLTDYRFEQQGQIVQDSINPFSNPKLKGIIGQDIPVIKP